MNGRICGECGSRGVFVVEPVGRYDFSGWAALPACEGHVGEVARRYMEELPRVQVRLITTPQLPEVETCRMEGCDRLVGDGFGCCHECEQAVFGEVS